MGRRSILIVVVFACVAGGSAAVAGSPAERCETPDETVPYTARAFLGYTCRDDECAAHKAGFAWADRLGIADPRGCAEIEEPAFGEGCRAFAEQAVTAEQSGFEWARENELADDCLCGGAGSRFAAGCEAYVTGFGR